ncbi:MAG: homocysteine S-methyltransferase [Chloroflexi bacterium]|nr:homocysteine S-methyltransferase [Chloroflexota bacterium]
MYKNNPLTPFLVGQGFLLLDGGLATELEKQGHDLNDPLWSARLLLENPEAIQQVHQDYLQAGADCLLTASYQATVVGFQQRGLSREQSVALMRRSVELALGVRDVFWADEVNRVGRPRPQIAASIGPYGAYLANGAEYTGDYDLDETGLLTFHRERWHILAESGADLLACETIPSAIEARALARLAQETPDTPVWVSFSCRNGEQINDGTLLAAAAAPLLDLPQVVALGVNCTAPSHIARLITHLKAVTDKPIVVYPNSGETYDAGQRCWSGISSAAEFAAASQTWFSAGASLIGGCCRTGPEHIRQMRQRLTALVD